jgi:hypothetical protein
LQESTVAAKVLFSFVRMPHSQHGSGKAIEQPERVIGFFNSYRHQYPVSREILRDIASQFQNWVVNRSQKWGAPILEAPEDRRDKFLDPYFRKAKPNQVVAIVKGREPARITIACVLTWCAAAPLAN